MLQAFCLRFSRRAVIARRCSMSTQFDGKTSGGGGWIKGTREMSTVLLCVYFFPIKADCRLVEWKFNIWCQNDKFTVQFTSMWFELSAYCFQFFFTVSSLLDCLELDHINNFIFLLTFNKIYCFRKRIVYVLRTSHAHDFVIAGRRRQKKPRQLSLHFRIQEGRNLCANK